MAARNVPVVPLITDQSLVPAAAPISSGAVVAAPAASGYAGWSTAQIVLIALGAVLVIICLVALYLHFTRKSAATPHAPGAPPGAPAGAQPIVAQAASATPAAAPQIAPAAPAPTSASHGAPTATPAPAAQLNSAHVAPVAQQYSAPAQQQYVPPVAQPAIAPTAPQYVALAMQPTLPNPALRQPIQPQIPRAHDAPPAGVPPEAHPASKQAHIADLAPLSTPQARAPIATTVTRPARPAAPSREPQKEEVKIQQSELPPAASAPAGVAKNADEDDSDMEVIDTSKMRINADDIYFEGIVVGGAP